MAESNEGPEPSPPAPISPVIPPAVVDRLFSLDVVVGADRSPVNYETRALDVTAGLGPIENQLSPEEMAELFPPPPSLLRRIRIPAILFVLTCLSTFWAGAAGIEGIDEALQFDTSAAWNTVAGNWWKGMTYMLAVMAILLAHEMGHFLQALRYRIPASLPFFIPMPITPIGTMGAVIGMQGSKADRRALFDIGISGPLAGLVLALPIAWFGILSAPLDDQKRIFQDPLVLKWLVNFLRPELQPGQHLKMESLYLAGWVGMLITGLNMLPMSLLDGGHVAYALFGRGAHWLARAMVLAAFAFILITGEYGWLVMLALVLYIGIAHPRTANDRASLGVWRYALGLLSLAIPILCFAPIPFKIE